MNYERIYNEFIADRRTKEAELVGYTEKHHIVPRSMGGADDASNLIRLTAGDHFFAHLLLAHVYGGRQWAGVYSMAKLQAKNRKITACRRMVELARKHALCINNPSTLPHVREMRRVQMTERNPIHTINRSGEHNPMFGKRLLKEANGMWGKKWSEETRKKMKDADRSALLRKKVKCLDTGELFNSVGEAATNKNTYRSAIAKASDGRAKTAGGYTWSYA